MDYDKAVNSTSPLIHGFVQEPDGRGTFSILWSCIAVLFLNTWTVLHLNVPPENRSAWRNFLHKTKWWIICAMCADGLCVNAYSQWRSARRSLPSMKASWPWWTLRHGFYAEMGGYCVKDELSGQAYLFRVDELEYLAKKNIIDLTSVSEAEIVDKSNTDELGKGIAGAQSAWFLIQAVARGVQHLPITTLELATIAFIGCTWSTYFFWWHKPMDVQTRTVISVPHLSAAQLCDLAKATCFGEKSSHWYRPPPRGAHTARWDYFWWEKPMILSSMTVVDTTAKLPQSLLFETASNFTALGRVTDWYMPCVNETHASEWGQLEHFTVWWIGVIFNGIHLAAWNFKFASEVESLMWKAAVLGMLTYTTLWVPVASLLFFLPPISRLKNTPYWVITLLYFVTRLYLIVEVFIGLRAC